MVLTILGRKQESDESSKVSIKAAYTRLSWFGDWKLLRTFLVANVGVNLCRKASFYIFSAEIQIQAYWMAPAINSNWMQGALKLISFPRHLDKCNRPDE